MITKYPLPISFARCFGQSLKGSLRSWIFWAIQVPLKQPIPRRWKNSKSGGEPVYSWAISICAWWCSSILSWGDFQTLGRRHTFSSETWSSEHHKSFHTSCPFHKYFLACCKLWLSLSKLIIPAESTVSWNLYSLSQKITYLLHFTSAQPLTSPRQHRYHRNILSQPLNIRLHRSCFSL